MNSSVLVLILLGGILLWFIYDTYGIGQYEYVTSTVDNNAYKVQTLPDKQQAANLLAHIRANLESVSRHLQKMYADDPRTERIVMKFDPTKMSEGSNHSEYTSFSINKGEQVVFCLRSKDENNKLVDLNTMMFVALHELAHICTESNGHTEEFWDNFRWLLHEAINIGVYKEQDFKSKPVPYCGINITETPLNT